jgi:hypothetical protein
LDLWPYVNGKALASHINLREMEASEMLDVVHYYFEADARYASGEEAEAVSKLRTSLYKLYDKTYIYTVNSSSRGQSGRAYVSGNDDDLLPTEFSPQQSKSYTPATKVDAEAPLPFGPVLDAPIGG